MKLEGLALGGELRRCAPILHNAGLPLGACSFAPPLRDGGRQRSFDLIDIILSLASKDSRQQRANEPRRDENHVHVLPIEHAGGNP